MEMVGGERRVPEHFVNPKRPHLLHTERKTYKKKKYNEDKRTSSFYGE